MFAGILLWNSIFQFTSAPFSLCSLWIICQSIITHTHSHTHTHTHTHTHSESLDKGHQIPSWTEMFFVKKQSPHPNPMSLYLLCLSVLLSFFSIISPSHLSHAWLTFSRAVILCFVKTELTHLHSSVFSFLMLCFLLLFPSQYLLFFWCFYVSYCSFAYCSCAQIQMISGVKVEGKCNMKCHMTWERAVSLWLADYPSM